MVFLYSPGCLCCHVSWPTAPSSVEAFHRRPPLLCVTRRPRPRLSNLPQKDGTRRRRHQRERYAMRTQIPQSRFETLVWSLIQSLLFCWLFAIKDHSIEKCIFSAKYTIKVWVNSTHKGVLVSLQILKKPTRVGWGLEDPWRAPRQLREPIKGRGSLRELLVWFWY